MRTAGLAPIAMIRRLHRLRRAALPLLAAVFFAVGLAQAGHLHKPDAVNPVASHCDLCLQFDRLTTPPAAPASTLAAAQWQRLLIVVLAAPVAADHYRPYRARGPPGS